MNELPKLPDFNDGWAIEIQLAWIEAWATAYVASTPISQNHIETVIMPTPPRYAPGEF